MSASVYRLLSQIMTLTCCRRGVIFYSQFCSLFKETALLNLEMNSAQMKRPTLPKRAESRVSLHSVNKQVMLVGETGRTKLFSTVSYVIYSEEKWLEGWWGAEFPSCSQCTFAKAKHNLWIFHPCNSHSNSLAFIHPPLFLQSQEES